MAKSKAKGPAEYYIRRMGPEEYQVSKFSGNDVPDVSYTVKLATSRERGSCDCPAGMYRKKGLEDKHIQMVMRWIDANEPQGVAFV